MTFGDLSHNRGAHPVPRLPEVRFPQVPPALGTVPAEARPAGAVDVLLANPPAPDGAIWIRSQHRVGRRSRENMIWPQVSLAQLAALLQPAYSVEIVDAIPGRMTWQAFEALLREKRPRYYVTQVTAPTLTNDMRGTFLARSLGATTVAFGTHVTPMPVQTLESFPTLDYVVRGEPELTLVELIETLEAGNRNGGEVGELLRRWEGLFRATDPAWQPASAARPSLANVKGLAWRDGGKVVVNADRPLIPDLDALPLPAHHLLPWQAYRAPGMRGPFTFVVPSRGCPAGCTFCIKHVSYGRAVRVRSAENVLAELRLLWGMGLRNVHMYADLFTVNREQVMGICEGMVREGLDFRWMCNSRVDHVDPEMLRAMKRAGCWIIAWGIE
ncbi:MAG: radical SAM protein, partial [Anaerolineae bacterium]|nr:radical SAM protein [Anaerolineae bacterium]